MVKRRKHPSALGGRNAYAAARIISGAASTPRITTLLSISQRRPLPAAAIIFDSVATACSAAQPSRRTAARRRSGAVRLQPRRPCPAPPAPSMLSWQRLQEHCSCPTRCSTHARQAGGRLPLPPPSHIRFRSRAETWHVMRSVCRERFGRARAAARPPHSLPISSCTLQASVASCRLLRSEAPPAHAAHAPAARCSLLPVTTRHKVKTKPQTRSHYRAAHVSLCVWQR